MDSLGLIYIRKFFIFYLRNSRVEILRCKIWKGNFWFKKRHHYYRRRRMASGGEMYCLRFWCKMAHWST